MNLPSFLSQLHPGRLLSPVCRRSFYEGLLGSDLPAQYGALSGFFPFRHASNLSLGPALRMGSSLLRVALQLGFPCYVRRESDCWVAIFRRQNGDSTIAHFRNGRLALLQEVITGHCAASQMIAQLEKQYAFRLPAQEEDFLVFNAAGERLVVRHGNGLQLFYLNAAQPLLASLPAQRRVLRHHKPKTQLAWVS